jgi:hypothetical protein
MSKTLRRCWQTAFAAAFAAALGLGATDAMAGVSPAQRDDICEDKCWNKYNACITWGLGNCQYTRDTCLANCEV